MFPPMDCSKQSGRLGLVRLAYVSLLAVLLTVAMVVAFARPAAADDDDHHGGKHGQRYEQGQDWRHGNPHWRAPPRPYYGPPPVIYAPAPYYAPPPVYYGQRPGVSLNFLFPFGR